MTNQNLKKNDLKDGDDQEKRDTDECPNCKGTGDNERGLRNKTGEPLLCDKCKGSGRQYERIPSSENILTRSHPKTGEKQEGRDLGECPSCKGTGDHESGLKDRTGEPLFCNNCGGCGRLYEWKTVSIPIKK